MIKADRTDELIKIPVESAAVTGTSVGITPPTLLWRPKKLKIKIIFFKKIFNFYTIVE